MSNAATAAQGDRICDRWPCPACKAKTLAEGAQRCLSETGHSDCAHNVTDSPCPNDDLFEAAD